MQTKKASKTTMTLDIGSDLHLPQNDMPQNSQLIVCPFELIRLIRSGGSETELILRRKIVLVILKLHFTTNLVPKFGAG